MSGIYKPVFVLMAFCFFSAGVESATASESLQELATGGLDFSPVANASALELRKEEVSVDLKDVKFTYVIANKGADPVEIGYQLRLPDLDFSDPDVEYAIPGSKPENFLDASVNVDGTDAPLKWTQTAVLNGKDVGAALLRNKIALVPVGPFQNELDQTSEADREKLQERGLIVESGTSIDGKPLYFPSWTVRTRASGEMTIPPMAEKSIALTYRVSLGVSPDTVLRVALRGRDGLKEEVAERRRDYCVDASFLSGLDRITGPDKENSSGIREARIHLVLGHVGTLTKALEYRLVVDKGDARDIVSFCSDKLRKISDAAFESQIQNAAPQGGLKLLIIQQLKQGIGNRP